MLSQSQRTTILELHAQGVKKREIARLLSVSRLSVRKVLRSNSAQVPALQRAEKAEPYRQQILELFCPLKGESCASPNSSPAGRCFNFRLDLRNSTRKANASNS